MRSGTNIMNLMNDIMEVTNRTDLDVCGWLQKKRMKSAIIGIREYTLKFTTTSDGTALHYRLRQPSPQI
jgi:hypothetical protein